MKNLFNSRPLIIVLAITMFGFILTSSCTASKRSGGCPMTAKASGYK